MKKLVGAIAVGAMLLGSQVALTTPVAAAGPGPAPGPAAHQTFNKGEPQSVRKVGPQKAGPQKGERPAFRKGERLPSNARPEVVKERDYKRYGLKKPPRGYQWQKVDDRFVMVAISTGIISSILGAIANR